METLNAHSIPLYRRVSDDILAQIESGTWKPGDKLPSERALCDRYQVSQITVRRALRELTHIGRVYSHHGLGWFVSPLAARSVPPQDVTLVLPELDWLTATLVHSLCEELELAGVTLRLAFTCCQDDAEATGVSRAIARGTSALLFAVSGQERHLAESLTHLLDGIGIPALLLLREVEGVAIPAVVLDEKLCMETITRHLLDLGHRRVAYAGGDPSLVEGQRRYWGFAATLWERGLELPLDWVFSKELTVDAEEQRFRRAFQDDERPTALVCASDVQAAQAMLLLRKLDLQCPGDVAIVGLGDREFAPYLSTPLTTFRFDLDALGKAAAGMTTALLAGRKVENTRVSGKLIKRESCGESDSRQP